MSFVPKAGARCPSPKRALAAAAVALLVLTACGGGDSEDGATGTAAGSPTTDGGDRVSASTVVLKNVKYTPEEITVKKGATVTWQWDDGTIPHDVDGGEAFKSEVQEKGTFEHTFNEVGVFEYKCTVHPTMTGSVEVTE